MMMYGRKLLGFCIAGALMLAVPAFSKEPDAALKAGSSMMKATPKPLDINTATVAELQALKGVGDKRAADIVKGRPYKGKDELVQKKILPQGVYDSIKDKIIAKQK